jgi:hypothetical protein
LPLQPAALPPAELAAVSFLPGAPGERKPCTSLTPREWFTWCQANGLDPLTGIQRAHVELYIRGLAERGLMDSSINTMMHAVRGYFRFAHIDGGAGVIIRAHLHQFRLIRRPSLEEMTIWRGIHREKISCHVSCLISFRWPPSPVYR